MILKYKKILCDAICPKYATDGSAGLDFFAPERFIPGEVKNYIPLKVDTGIAVEIPEGFVMLMFSRSGHGFKNGVRLSNCVGVIDSDYRGSIVVSLANDSYNPMPVLPGERVAQGLIVPIALARLIQVEELGTTERGAGGFGSTGK